MGKICLTCEVSNKMNKAELEKIIPDWYKEIGNYSLLPPFLNNNDKYNANKRTLQTIKPNITNYEVNIKLNEKPNTWICYWAAEYTNDFMKIKSAKEAYNTFKNHGLVKTNSSGDVVFVLNCPQPYSVDDTTYPRHVHYCLLNRDNFWSDNIKTVIVSCKIDFKMMREYNHKKCHFLINALPRDNYDRCHIPNSYNLPVSLIDRSSSQEKRTKVKKFLEDNLSNYPRLNKSVKGKKLNIFNLPIVVYCAHSKCHASEKLIEHLIDAGFVNILEYPGGTKEWKLKEKDSMQDTCFMDEEKSGGGGYLKEIKQQEKITNWSYSDNEVEDKVEEKVEDKGSKPDKKSKKTKKNTSKKKKVKEVKEKEPEPKVVKKKKVSDEFDLEAQFEKLVYEDIVYIHNLENNKVYNLNDEEIGVYKNKRIKWTDDEYKKQHLVAKDKYNEEYNKELVLSSSEDEDDSSDESSSDDESILEEISDIKKEVDNIKYRKHKLSLKCMSNVTPKVYNNKFRGWGLTYWGD
jgi:rhodanese-related sulfurtransferase